MEAPGLDLGGSGHDFDWILEAPGLDLGGSGDDFCYLFVHFEICCIEAVPPAISQPSSSNLCQWTPRELLRMAKDRPAPRTLIIIGSARQYQREDNSSDFDDFWNEIDRVHPNLFFKMNCKTVAPNIPRHRDALQYRDIANCSSVMHRSLLSGLLPLFGLGGMREA